MADDERHQREQRGRRELWLGELLDAAADEYEPDPERLKAMVTARIAQQSDEAEATATAPTTGRSASSRRSGRRAPGNNNGRPRSRRLGLIGRLGLAGIPAGVALTTIGAAAALAVGATATIAVTSSHDHNTVTVAAPSSTPGHGGSSSQNTESGGSPAATDTTTHPATTGSPSTATTTSSAGTTTKSSTTSTLLAAAPSIDKNSNPDWAQLDLTVTIKQPLTALDITVKVSKCDGLVSTGAWDSGATGQFTETTTTDSAGSITYEFELTHGDEASPGTVTFAAQFNHAATGWNVAEDTYYVSARTATSTSASATQGAYQG